VAEFALRTEAFRHGGEIPRRHTCDGGDIAPALSGRLLTTTELMGMYER
jgi:phosphatidylethanolamine-binding protein (PEBP) family uncharacterized protein